MVTFSVFLTVISLIKMKALVLLIFGFIAVVANGAAIGDGTEITMNVDQKTSEYETTEKAVLEESDTRDDEITDADSEIFFPDGPPTNTETGATAAATADAGGQMSTGVDESLQPSVLDVVPYPMNIILKTFSKNAVKSMDVETMCDSLQLIDWKTYQKMLEAEDFTGLKDAIGKDHMMNAAAEAFQEATSSYINKTLTTLSKSIKIEGLDTMQKNLKELLNVISLNLGGQSDTKIQNNVKSLSGNMKIDPKVQKEVLQNMQKNIDKMVAMLTAARSQNTADASAKTEISA